MFANVRNAGRVWFFSFERNYNSVIHGSFSNYKWIRERIPPFNILLLPLTHKLLCSKYVSDKMRLIFSSNRKHKFISINPLISGKRTFF